jgi:hypothetical protein
MALIGTNLRETFNALKQDKNQSIKMFGASSNGKPGGIAPKEAWARLLVTVLLAGIAVWLLHGDTKSQSGMTIIGFIAGYWLK